MFREFCEFFNIPEVDKNKYEYEVKDNIREFSNRVSGFNELLSNYQGISFGQGLYRLHNYASIDKWNKIVSEAFPEFKDRIQCFGYDWLGRQFSLDKSRIVDGEPQILMFEPGTGEVLEIPCNFMEFHNEEIPNYHDACLASEFFNDWMRINKAKLVQQECAGYKILLFLGGADTVENLEKSDMEIYWSICAQLINKTRDLPEGTKIKGIEIPN